MDSGPGKHQRCSIDFFQDLLDCPPGAVCTLDRTGHFTYLNTAACRLLGYPDEAALLGLSFEAVVDAECSQATEHALTERLIEVAATGEPLCDDSTVCLRSRTGDALPVMIDASVLRRGAMVASGVVVALRYCATQHKREAELQREACAAEAAEAAQRLQQRERELAEAQRIAQIGSWSWDLQTGYSEISAETYRIFGTTAEAFEHTREGFLATVHPDDRATVEAELEAILRHRNESWETEFRIVRADDGAVRTVYERGQVQFDETGQPQRIIGTIQDVTEQRERERFQQQLIAILDNTPDLIALHDVDGQLIYFNKAGRERFGLPRPPHFGDPGGAQVDDSLPFCHSVEEAIRRRHPPWAIDLLLNEGLPTARREGLWQGCVAFLDASGAEVAASQVIIGHRDAAGNVVQISTIIRDISELNRAQQEVAESEQRFRLIADKIHDAFWLRMPERALYVNSAYERILGEPVERFYANPNSFLERVHPEDRGGVEAALHHAIAAYEELDIRFRIIRPDGAVRWIHVRSQTVSANGAGEKMRAGIARDITDEAAALEWLKQLVAILDNTSDIVSLHSKEGGLLYLNAAGRALVGVAEPTGNHPLSEGYGDPLPQLSTEEASRRFHPLWAADLLLNEGLPTARREGLWHGETAIIGADGEEIPTSQVLIGHRNAAGEVTQISTILRSIKEQREVEEALRESEEKHRRLFETMAQGVVYHAEDGTIISANPAAERILGLSLAQMQNRSPISPNWKIITEDGATVPGTDYPVILALRTGKTYGPEVRGVVVQW